MEETDANVTTGSIRSAAAVLRSLADAAARPSREHGEYLAMAQRLERVADERDSTEGEERVIPLPEAQLQQSEEAAAQVLQAVEGYADEEFHNP